MLKREQDVKRKESPKADKANGLNRKNMEESIQPSSQEITK